jgi:hypothetical protein
MKKALYLLPILALFACSRETFDPIEETETLYYLLIKVDDVENMNSLKSKAAEIARQYGQYRITNVFLGKENETPVLITRRFSTTREAEKLMKGLRKNKQLRKLEMKHISQANYREMLRQGTFYPDYSKDPSLD